MLNKRTVSLTTAAALLLAGTSLASQAHPSIRAGKDGQTCSAASLDQQALHLEAAHLKTFDILDFDVLTVQKWNRLKESHTANVLVHWPDGHTTTGIDVHINDLKALFVYAPDTRILDHPIRTACGDLTTVTGVF